jgi:hypothetical protein
MHRSSIEKLVAKANSSNSLLILIFLLPVVDSHDVEATTWQMRASAAVAEVRRSDI